MKKSKSQAQQDREQGEKQQAAEERGAKIPYYTREVTKELLKPAGSSGKR